VVISGRPVAAWVALAALLPLLAGLAGALWLRGQGDSMGAAVLPVWLALAVAFAAWSGRAAWLGSRWELAWNEAGFTLDGETVELRPAAVFSSGMLLMARPHRARSTRWRPFADRWLAFAAAGGDPEARHRLHGLRLALAHAGRERAPAR
jgi:hypothetical protein